MDAQQIQDKIYEKGYGKVADHIGFLYTIYRSSDGDNPIQPANIIGEIKVAPTTTWTWMMVKKYGDSTWILVVDGRGLEVGDYLVGELRTFFIASMEKILPILGVMCDRKITIVRPKTTEGIGDVGYSGYVQGDASTFDVLHTSVPSSFLKSSRGEKNPVKLPTDAKMPWYAVYLPQWDSVFLRNGDIIIDENQQDYIISDNEHTPLGWHLNVHGLEA